MISMTLLPFVAIEDTVSVVLYDSMGEERTSSSAVLRIRVWKKDLARLMEFECYLGGIAGGVGTS